MEIGNVRTEMRDLRTEMRTEARDLRTEMRTEMRDLRGQVERLEDSTAASFEAVRQQLVAVAVCTLELRNAVAAAGRSAQNGDRGAEFTACDSAQRAILTPSTPSSP